MVKVFRGWEKQLYTTNKPSFNKLRNEVVSRLEKCLVKLLNLSRIPLSCLIWCETITTLINRRIRTGNCDPCVINIWYFLGFDELLHRVLLLPREYSHATLHRYNIQYSTSDILKLESYCFVLSQFDFCSLLLVPNSVQRRFRFNCRSERVITRVRCSRWLK